MSSRFSGSSSVKSSPSNYSDAENKDIDGIATKICGQGVLNKLVGNRGGAGHRHDYSFLGAGRYISVPTFNSSPEKPTPLSPTKQQNLLQRHNDINDSHSTSPSKSTPRNSSENFLEFDHGLNDVHLSTPSKHTAQSIFDFSKQSKQDRKRNDANCIEDGRSKSNRNSNTKQQHGVPSLLNLSSSSSEQDILESERIVLRQPTSSPLTGFKSSFRAQHWSLTLPAVMEETMTYETEDETKSPTHSSVRSPAHITLSPTSQPETNDKKQSQQEVLCAMKELILKQQEAIKDLSNVNIQNRAQLVSCHDEIRKLRDNKKESQQRIISLVLEKESFENEAKCLREEIQGLRSAVHEMTSDRELLNKFENWIDEKVPSASLVKSTTQHSVEGSQDIVRVSSSSSLSSFDNFEDVMRPKVYPQIPSGVAKDNHISPTVRDDRSMDDEGFEESHEIVMMSPEGRDALDELRSNNSDSIDDEFFELDDKFRSPFMSSTTPTNETSYKMSFSNQSTSTTEWANSTDGTLSEYDRPDSMHSAHSTKEEVATFKSRLGSIQRRRLSRQQTRQKDDSTTKKVRSPLVRFGM